MQFFPGLFISSAFLLVVLQYSYFCFAIFKQVIIDGIGIFCMCLGKDFSSSGFLHSSLWLLLQNLICSNFLIRSASDAVLHIIAAMHKYETVSNY